MKTLRTHRIRFRNWPTWIGPIGSCSHTSLAALVLVSFCVAQGSDTQPTTTKPLALSRADKNKVIYVSDFDLDPNNFKQDKGGVTGKGYLLPPPPKSFPSLRRRRQDPATEASKLIRLMSESLVSELSRAGFRACRLLQADTRPTEGLIVSGVFTELDEGNQMRRALLGFGSGTAKMELYVTIADASHAGQPLYDTLAKKSGGKRPGAVIALNPYASAASFVAKFAMTKNAPETMVKKTASKIATELTEQLNTHVLVADQRVSNH